MRSSKQRSRSKSNRPKSLGNIVNRVFDSSGPEGKVRGTPQQIIDKYLVLARDAQLSGDRVAHENFLQHAEHYTRMLGEAQREMAREQDARREQQQQQHQQNGQNRRADARDGGERQSRDEQEPGQGRADGMRRQDERDERGRDASHRAGDAPLAAVDAGDESDSMLVETPESRAAKDAAGPGGPPAFVAAEEPSGGGEAAAESAGEAGDGGKRKRQSRAPSRRMPRKPKTAGNGADSGGGSAAAAE